MLANKFTMCYIERNLNDDTYIISVDNVLVISDPQMVSTDPNYLSGKINTTTLLFVTCANIVSVACSMREPLDSVKAFTNVIGEKIVVAHNFVSVDGVVTAVNSFTSKLYAYHLGRETFDQLYDRFAVDVPKVNVSSEELISDLTPKTDLIINGGADYVE